MVDVTTRSRKSRSWLTSSTVPGCSASCSCKRSSVSRSRSLVGSSSTSKLHGRAKARAKVRRDGAPQTLAARLQALAGPGTLVIAESTRRQIGALFEIEDLGLQPLAGFAEPQRAWRVLGESGV